MQKMKSALNVDFVNETFFPQYTDVTDINRGECFVWAYIAYRLFPNLELWDMEAHAFVRSKVTGKFYDSETPEGVEDYKDLPATFNGKGCGCEICGQPAKKYTSMRQYKYEWRFQIKRFSVDFNDLNKKIRKTIQETNP